MQAIYIDVIDKAWLSLSLLQFCRYSSGEKEKESCLKFEKS